MRPALRDFSPSALAAGLLAGFVGATSTFAVILQGLAAVGASPAQAASGLMAVSIAMGVCGVGLSLWRRLPISIAWSTPGAAFLASSAAPAGGFAVSVGAFVVCGALIVAAGLFRPLGRWVAAIPAPLANAMLGGVLLNLCLAPARAVVAAPAAGLAVVVVWAVMGRLRPRLAMPAAVLVACVVIAVTGGGGGAGAAPHAELVLPRFTVPAIIGLALPLFIVTMASQNVPGIAVLGVHGYRPAPGPLFTTTGAASVLAAPFCALPINLAAITAALCAGPDAHPDPARRYWAAVIAGLFYLVFGLAAASVTGFVAAGPPLLIEAVAGLALLGAFSASLLGAMGEAKSREAAAVTFVVAASGLTVLGIGGAFWGLLAGGAMLALARTR